MIVRRTLVAGGLAVVLAASTVVPAFADDLSDYLANAENAVYSGRRVTGTIWDGVERVGMVEIQHHDGTTFVESSSGVASIGDGSVHIGGSDEAAVSFARDPHSEVEGRYTVVPGEATVYLGRPAKVIDVMEGSLRRMRLVVDDATAAPVATEIYGPDGEVFRYSTMLDFSVSVPAESATQAAGTPDTETMEPLKTDGFPDEASGYHLVDVYDGPDGSHQAFYSDGLFSFSLFVDHGWTDWHAVSDDELPYLVGDAPYLRVIGPASVWVLWNSRDMSLALVGDLPPDHIEQVLEQFPRPARRAWYKAIWFRVFG